MEKADKTLEQALEAATPDEPIRVILQASPEPQPGDAIAWKSWAEAAYLEDASAATGMTPSNYAPMPNLRMIVATAPQAMVRKWLEAPETKSIRLQPPDNAVEFLEPVEMSPSLRKLTVEPE